MARVRSVQDDLETTRKGYDEQLAALTEHLMDVNTQLADAQDEVAAWRARDPNPPPPKKGSRWR